jgi:hypothetical protein
VTGPRRNSPAATGAQADIDWRYLPSLRPKLTWIGCLGALADNPCQFERAPRHRMERDPQSAQRVERDTQSGERKERDSHCSRSSGTKSTMPINRPEPCGALTWGFAHNRDVGRRCHCEFRYFRWPQGAGDCGSRSSRCRGWMQERAGGPTRGRARQRQDGMAGGALKLTTRRDGARGGQSWRWDGRLPPAWGGPIL